ncbi:response regulator transcription factor [Jeotgalibaca caeni]|uniref:response regulator transcription factor n=1 Tax=Jeotgalibaca caeni TaxID=3028623 RepID=UPI00237D6893|nr:response regulator [Jeotgalibaca caeni]MDE1548624.1 response regulator [Jeotgalibaca caeni]
MYRVVVVEDDRIIRRAIVQSEWHKIGAEVVGEAADGQQALEVIKETRPHLVVTDINMPFMDGITFAKELRAFDNHVRLIFLTGYDDFEYVREAMLLKSDDYLLKPVQQEELFEKAEKALAFWSQEFEKNERLLESIPLLQQRFVTQVLFHPHPEMQIDIQQELFHLNVFLSGPNFRVVHVAVPDYRGQKPLYTYLSKWQRSNEIEVLAYQNNEAFVLLSVDPIDQGWVEELAEEMLTELSQELTDTVYLSSSTVYSEMQDLETAFLEAKIKMEKKKIEGYQSGETEEPRGFAESQSDYDVLERTKAFLGMLRTQPLLVAEAKRLSFNLVMYLSSVLNRTVKEEADQVNIYEVSQQVLQANQTSTIFSVIEPLVERWEEELKKQQWHTQSNSLVQQAIAYMREHYHEPDLSLVTLANQIHITSPYLSNLFKSETGRNFTEYLLEMRMEEAKELLRTTMSKTYEIAERVGYLNPHYFSSSFKKYTGETPIEYRKKNQ